MEDDISNNYDRLLAQYEDSNLSIRDSQHLGLKLFWGVLSNNWTTNQQQYIWGNNSFLKNFGIINTFLSDLYDVSSIWYSAIGVSLVLILALVSSCIFPSKVCLFVCRTLMSSSVKLWKLRKWGIQQVNAHWVFCAKVKSCLQMGQFPQDGENGQNVAFFLLWPNVLTFSTFLNCSEQILPGAF